jgi:glycosyltransferase involved in cell wall biosynthesis
MQQALAGSDVQILTATPGEQVRAGREVIDGIAVSRITARLPGDLPIHPRTRHHVARELRDHPVDIVHVHVGVISPFAWGAIRAAHELSIPTLVTVHGIWGPIAAPGYRLSEMIAKWSKWGVQVTAVSDVAASKISAALPGIQEVLILPNGIDPARWQLPARHHNTDTLNLVTVMRLAPRKRTLPLLKIIQSAQDRVGANPHLHLRLVGDGPQRSRAESFVRHHGLNSLVSFTGRLDHGGIREVFAMSDIYVQPSIKESFGLAALEARAAGLPVIARSQTGTTQFIRDQQEGLLATTDSGMADAIARLATDRALLAQLTEHNRENTPEQSWSQVLVRVDEAYARALHLD